MTLVMRLVISYGAVFFFDNEYNIRLNQTLSLFMHAQSLTLRDLLRTLIASVGSLEIFALLHNNCG